MTGGPLVGSGFLVGPRHILTAVHVTGKTTTGANLRFTVRLPSQSVTFSIGFGVKVTFNVPATVVAANVIDAFPAGFDVLDEYLIYDCERSTDMSCLVLDQNLGDQLGVFELRDIQANPLPAGTKISEAGVRGGGLQYNDATCKVTETENCWWDGYVVKHNCDTMPGHSGGPIYIQSGTQAPGALGSWLGEGLTATAIGVHVAYDSWWPAENTAAGGPDMLKIVEQAISKHP